MILKFYCRPVQKQILMTKIVKFTLNKCRYFRLKLLKKFFKTTVKGLPAQKKPSVQLLKICEFDFFLLFGMAFIDPGSLIN